MWVNTVKTVPVSFRKKGGYGFSVQINRNCANYIRINRIFNNGIMSNLR